MEHDELNQLLARHKVPMARPDLAERIIHAAISQPQEKPRRASTWWNDVLSMFVLPHPSVAVVTGVLFGLVVGMQASDGLTVLQQDWSSFLYINEGGWL